MEVCVGPVGSERMWSATANPITFREKQSITARNAQPVQVLMYVTSPTQDVHRGHCLQDRERSNMVPVVRMRCRT
jgi:hypothetical protein